MFIETYSASNTGPILSFLKSLDVQAYPCGRRRGKAEFEGEPDKTFYLPIDPEARLNTEDNHRKHSSLNGFTQTYIKNFTERNLTFAIAGYLFNIKLNIIIDNLSELDDPKEEVSTVFGTRLIDAITEASASDEEIASDKIYANIRIHETKLFSGLDDYYTGVLRDQTDADLARTELDIIRSSALAIPSESDLDDANNYYFSGLSFSTKPLTSSITSAGYPEADFIIETVETNNTREVKNIYKNVKTGEPPLYQQVVSLCILKKFEDEETGEIIWRINEAAFLPHIEHGDTEDSIVLNKVDLESLGANNITTNELTVNEIIEASNAALRAKTIKQGGKEVPMLEMQQQTDGNATTYRMRFYYMREQA